MGPDLPPYRSSIIYAGTETGVYVSTDAGGRWNPMSQGLISTWVRSIVVDRTGSRLYAGVAGGGMYRIDSGWPDSPLTLLGAVQDGLTGDWAAGGSSCWPSGSASCASGRSPWPTSCPLVFAPLAVAMFEWLR